jgi:integrase
MPVFKRISCSCKNKQKCGHKEIWYYAFCIRRTRYRKAVPEARTKSQAEQAEVRAKEQVYQGKYGKEPSNITLREFVEKTFLPWAKNEKKSWKNDYSRSKPILSYFKNKRMREIVQMNVLAYRKERLHSYNGMGALRAPASVDREIQLPSRIYSLGIERGYVDVNPCKGVKLSCVGKTVTRYLTPEEEERLIPFLCGRRRHLLDIIQIDLSTGMRRNEILSLHKSQIDFLRNSIELHDTKGGKSRSVPMHETIRPVFERLCQKARPSGYLFENPRTGNPIKDIKTAWWNALKDAGITGLRFHDLRHTFGTRAIDNGAPLSAVKDVMGHMDIRTTMRYVHATDEGKRRAVDAAISGKTNLATVLPQRVKSTA